MYDTIGLLAAALEALRLLEHNDTSSARLVVIRSAKQNVETALKQLSEEPARRPKRA